MYILFCCLIIGAGVPLLGLWIFNLWDELAYQRRMAGYWFKQAEHYRKQAGCD